MFLFHLFGVWHSYTGYNIHSSYGTSFSPDISGWGKDVGKLTDDSENKFSSGIPSGLTCQSKASFFKVVITFPDQYNHVQSVNTKPPCRNDGAGCNSLGSSEFFFKKMFLYIQAIRLYTFPLLPPLQTTLNYNLIWMYTSVIMLFIFCLTAIFSNIMM